jgi:hypothetical protein
MNIPSLGVAHSVALTMARVFIGTRSPTGHLSIAESDFHVEVINEDGRTVLAVPGRWTGPVPDRVR